MLQARKRLMRQGISAKLMLTGAMV
jgi:hypothetical protein